MRALLAALLGLAGCFDFDVSHRVDGGTTPDAALAPGGRWNAVAPTTSADLISVWATGTLVFIVEKGTGKLLLSSTSGATFSEITLSPPIDPVRVFGTGPNDVWVVATSGAAYHSDNGGGTWTVSATLPSTNPTALFAFAPARPMVASSGGIATFDGFQWNQHALPLSVTMHAIGGTSSSDLWTAGDSGLIFFSNDSGNTWQPTENLTSSTLRAVFARAPGLLTMVGDNGVILDGGGSLIQVPNADKHNLNGVWANSTTDIYMVGAGGTILHSLNFTLQADDTPTSNDLFAVFGTGVPNVFAVGAHGTILRL